MLVSLAVPRRARRRALPVSQRKRSFYAFPDLFAAAAFAAAAGAAPRKTLAHPLAGVFLGVKYTAYPTMGNLTNKAFISAVFGGLGSLPGAILGAVILGVLETMISAYVSSSLRNVFAYGLLIAILLIRPTGLMGKSADDKA